MFRRGRGCSLLLALMAFALTTHHRSLALPARTTFLSPRTRWTTEDQDVHLPASGDFVTSPFPSGARRLSSLPSGASRTRLPASLLLRDADSWRRVLGEDLASGQSGLESPHRTRPDPRIPPVQLSLYDQVHLGYNPDASPFSVPAVDAFLSEAGEPQSPDRSHLHRDIGRPWFRLGASKDRDRAIAETLTRATDALLDAADVVGELEEEEEAVAELLKETEEEEIGKAGPRRGRDDKESVKRSPSASFLCHLVGFPMGGSECIKQQQQQRQKPKRFPLSGNLWDPPVSSSSAAELPPKQPRGPRDQYPSLYLLGAVGR